MKAQNYFTMIFGLMMSVNFAQTTISGSVIIDGYEDSLDGKNIIIINQNTNKRVLADKDGLFRIEVALNDVIEVRSALTETRKIKISENILDKKYVEIHLDIETIELAEANIRPLDPNLKKNISTTETAEYKLKKELGYDTPEFKKAMIAEHKDAATRRAIAQTGGVNLLGIGQAIFGGKDKSKPPRELTNFEVTQKVKEYYPESYFVNSLNIPENKIQDFVAVCVNKYNFRSFLKQQDYDMIVYYMELEAPVFLRLISSQS